MLNFGFIYLVFCLLLRINDLRELSNGKQVAPDVCTIIKENIFEIVIRVYAYILGGFGLSVILYTYFFVYKKIQAWSFLQYIALTDRFKNTSKASYESIRVPKSWFTYFYAVGVPAVGYFTILEIFSSNLNVTTTCLFVTYWFHLIRRLYECLFVSMFSGAKMSLLHFLLGITFYVESPASMYISRDLAPDRSLMEISLFILMSCLLQALQHTAFVQLASLRQKSENDHVSSSDSTESKSDSPTNFGNKIFTQSEVSLRAASQFIEGIPDEQRTSPVRRTLLLTMLFDLLLCSVLWIFYVQETVGANETLIIAFRREVVKYTYRTSLFDCMILTFIRFLLIELVYGACHSRTPWLSATATGVASFSLLLKCFIFKFTASIQLAYAVVITQIVLTWVETGFLICRVLPQEKAAYNAFSSLLPDERRSLLAPSVGGRRSNYYGGVGSSTFYTPRNSIISAFEPHRPIFEVSSARDAIIDISALLDRSSRLQSELWFLFNLDVWDKPSGLLSPRDELLEQSHSCQAKFVDGYPVKVYRLETVLPVNPSVLHDDLVNNVEDVPKWNPSVASITRIQILLSESIDVVHNVVADASRGTMSPRDFVLLRTWGQFEDMLFVASWSVEHPQCPARSSCVRAHQLINGYIIIPMESENMCRLVWFMSNDLKLIMPQMFLDRLVVSHLSGLIKNLKVRADQLNYSTPRTSCMTTGPSSDTPPPPSPSTSPDQSRRIESLL